MEQKVITGDCINCESGFEIQYYKEFVSEEYPKYCPFCGEVIEDINDEYIEDEEDWDDNDDDGLDPRW